MKTILIFLVLALAAFHAKAAPAVENTAASVDKYQHELICQAQSGGENYLLTVKWKNLRMATGRAPYFSQAFSYELQNLNDGSAWAGDYQDFFSENVNISDNGGLSLLGTFFMYKRLGTLSHSAFLEFVKDGQEYHPVSLQLTAGETFESPKDYCNPPTRLCGSEPVAPEKIVLQVEFTESACQYNAL